MEEGKRRRKRRRKRGMGGRERGREESREEGMVVLLWSAGWWSVLTSTAIVYSTSDALPDLNLPPSLSLSPSFQSLTHTHSLSLSPSRYPSLHSLPVLVYFTCIHCHPSVILRLPFILTLSSISFLLLLLLLVHQQHVPTLSLHNRTRSVTLIR